MKLDLGVSMRATWHTTTRMTAISTQEQILFLDSSTLRKTFELYAALRVVESVLLYTKI